MARGCLTQRHGGREREMPGGMGKMELCYLASLLLCDKECFNAEMAEEQRGENLTIGIKGAIGLGEKGAEFCEWGEKNGMILICYET